MYLFHFILENMYLKVYELHILMRVCSECKVKKSYWDFNRGRNICKHCLTHRVCSRCDVKKHENDFEKNANGDYFRMCNDCRSICREHSKQTNETVRALPLEEQYVECEKCFRKIICFHQVFKGSVIMPTTCC